eukprot:6182433-Pleurochrysis_carterae.AAC.1
MGNSRWTDRYIRKLGNEGKRKTEGDTDSDTGMDLGGQEGRREVEKFVHGIRVGEVIGRPENARRTRHATREGNKPSFWTDLKENGCRGCQKQEEKLTIQHVLSGGCEATWRKANSRYRGEMRRILERCKKSMNDKQNTEGVEQADKVIRAIERPMGRHTNINNKEEEELALRQMISGIIPEWQENNEKEGEEKNDSNDKTMDGR